MSKSTIHEDDTKDNDLPTDLTTDIDIDVTNGFTLHVVKLLSPGKPHALVPVTSATTIREVIDLVEKCPNPRDDGGNLVFGLRPMAHSKTLAECHITEGCRVAYVRRMYGD